MDVRATGVLLILVPIAFNVAFFELGRAFEYPAILRKEPDEILRRFAAGGTGLLLRWHLLFVTALAMMPLAVLLSLVLAFDAGSALTTLTMVVGVVAGVVQALGLGRVAEPRQIERHRLSLLSVRCIDSSARWYRSRDSNSNGLAARGV